MANQKRSLSVEARARIAIGIIVVMLTGVAIYVWLLVGER